MIYYVLPALLAVDLVGQIGRGILIGSLAAPVSVVTFTVGFVVAHAIGPI
jgi:hypothetical protein